MKYFYLWLIAMMSSIVCDAKEESQAGATDITANEQTSIWGNPWILVGTVVFIYLFLAVTGGRSLNSPKL